MSATDYKKMVEDRPTDRYGSTAEMNNVINDPTMDDRNAHNDGLMRGSSSDESSYDDDHDDMSTDGEQMTIEELVYSSSSYYAIAKPVTLTMILSALVVVLVNDSATQEGNEAAMASAYQYFSVNDVGQSSGQNLANSLANALIIVSVICAMTFMIVLLYRMKFMKCLIGYMIFCSGTLLGILGGNVLQTAVQVYHIPVDKGTFYLFIYNFCIVGVLAVFFGQGIPTFVTQGYLIATSVILAWHLSFFDNWTAWTLLLMLALYDLCAVLTPCGPLKFLVEAMSQEGSPEMPGLLFEAELPPEAKRPGGSSRGRSQISTSSSDAERSASPNSRAQQQGTPGESPRVKIPLAIARVYQLPVVSVPSSSITIMFPDRANDLTGSTTSPLLTHSDSTIVLPENPSAEQLLAKVVVRLPTHGGRLEHVQRRGKKVYLERDRHGVPKRYLWVDRNGKVFAEMKDGDEERPEKNSIRLGLGDFIFYSVLVAKAAQYSFAAFAACTLVILAGLGGTLVLLSVYHHALPALPISIFMGIVFYVLTRWFIEPWVEAVLDKPYYV